MLDPTEALMESLRGLSRFMLGDETPREGLLCVARLGESAIGGAETTGVTLLEDGRPKTFVSTDDKAPEVDQVQYEEGDGPCLTAYQRQEVIRVESNRTETRWPTYARRACEKGILSSLSLPLAVEDRSLGAINFYSHHEGAFSEADEQVGMAFAEHAAVIVANAQAYWDARERSMHLDEAMRLQASSNRPRASSWPSSR